jgi:beta-glucosidase
MSKSFPKDFYWGASTSAHQIEGRLTNNWTEWEKDHAIEESRFYIGKSQRNINYPIGKENIEDAKSRENYISGIACDSFHRYREDVDLLKKMGLNSYRFSLAWSRIEPKEGEFSEEGIQYYKALIKELREVGIEPFVTCWHWDFPLWLTHKGGLLAKDVVEYFRRYVEFVVKHLGEDVDYWMTINEPLVFSTAAYLIGKWPPEKRNIFKFYKAAFVNLVKLHKVGYDVIKGFDSSLMVSLAKNNQFFEPYNRNLINRIVFILPRYINNYLFLDKVKGYLDYIGINFYAHSLVGIRGLRNTNDKLSDMGWWMKPRSISKVLKEVKDRYDLPVIVSENGVADREGKYREWWLDETVEGMREALEYGVDLRGYMHWSLLDNFEWAEGFWPRFGLATRDRELKESGYYYKRLIEEL